MKSDTKNVTTEAPENKKEKEFSEVSETYLRSTKEVKTNRETTKNVRKTRSTF